MDREKTRAIIRKLGGAAAVADALGIRSQAVSQWSLIPVERCKAIEEWTNGKYPRAKLRPDVFA